MRILIQPVSNILCPTASFLPFHKFILVLTFFRKSLKFTIEIVNKCLFNIVSWCSLAVNPSQCAGRMSSWFLVSDQDQRYQIYVVQLLLKFILFRCPQNNVLLILIVSTICLHLYVAVNRFLTSLPVQVFNLLGRKKFTSIFLYFPFYLTQFHSYDHDQTLRRFQELSVIY